MNNITVNKLLTKFSSTISYTLLYGSAVGENIYIKDAKNISPGASNAG